jgi:hypothetical protein
MLGAGQPVQAQQRPGAQEATLFLLLPVGARAAGIGNATASASGITEAVWWNPAGIATIRRGEASLNHSQTLIGTGDALVVAVGTPIGVVALSANVLDYGGDQGVRGPDSIPGGQLLARNVAFVATHAARIGRDIRVGASYKLLQFRFDCSGECPSLPSLLASTSAFDVGVQYDLPTKLPIHLGATVRNLGVRVQDDAPDEELPTRVQVGAAVSYRLPQAVAENARFTVAVDVIDEPKLRGPLPRAGAEFAWEDAVFIRGGYVFEERNTEAGGASLGIGFAVRRLTIDFARNFSGLSADAGQPPAYLSLRVAF